MTTDRTPSAREGTVAIPGLPPTVNATRRLHPMARAAEMRRWRGAAYMLGRDAWPYDHPIDPAELELVFVVPDRRIHDLDGLVGAAKPLIDGLVDAGILAGDDTRHVRSIRASYRVEPGVREVRVTVRAAMEEPS